MNKAARSVLLALALSASSLGLATPLTPAQQAEAEHISNNLRCPICTSQSITESANDISREMRGEVARMVAEGRNEGEIYDHFAARYGQFVLLDPPKEGAGLLLWLAPVLALGAGGYWLTRHLRQSQTAKAAMPDASSNTSQSSHASETRDDLTPYLTQVQSETSKKGQQP